MSTSSASRAVPDGGEGESRAVDVVVQWRRAVDFVVVSYAVDSVVQSSHAVDFVVESVPNEGGGESRCRLRRRVAHSVRRGRRRVAQCKTRRRRVRLSTTPLSPAVDPAVESRAVDFVVQSRRAVDPAVQSRCRRRRPRLAQCQTREEESPALSTSSTARRAVDFVGESLAVDFVVESRAVDLVVKSRAVPDEEEESRAVDPRRPIALSTSSSSPALSTSSSRSALSNSSRVASRYRLRVQSRCRLRRPVALSTSSLSRAVDSAGSSRLTWFRCGSPATRCEAEVSKIGLMEDACAADGAPELGNSERSMGLRMCMQVNVHSGLLSRNAAAGRRETVT
ncbi:uncharacterized protein SCHCODRAFT_02594647 [Schizophyllum commune H4-8]|nr:uncharacterized protein SCHCODRAFT_02594647 [Schizophyllum commune H4-8]KAI5884819.1 hypothetical protein SCHCODRAFT_02594647 [Schizophyllum commune H4-8]